MNDEKYGTIKIAELKIGMYVILQLPWYAHPFVKNQFPIDSEKDIEKIRSLGLKYIDVDPSKYQYREEQLSKNASLQSEAESTMKPRKIIPEELVTTIHDEHLPPKQKAILVQQHSFTMMKNLLEQPTIDNMREAKKGISEVVGLILRDEMTLHYLLNITSHDFYTYTHSVNVGVLSVALSKSLFGISGNHDLHALGAGFFLHDLGKVNINKDIINKPGKLSDEEMKEMRHHPALGFKLLHETRQLTVEAKTIVLQHHGRADGQGYPKGLRGHDIHVYGRICAIADVYDALTSDRPYRKKMKPYDALNLMRNEMIEHFQKDLFERFVVLFKAPKGLQT